MTTANGQLFAGLQDGSIIACDVARQRVVGDADSSDEAPADPGWAVLGAHSPNRVFALAVSADQDFLYSGADESTGRRWSTGYVNFDIILLRSRPFLTESSAICRHTCAVGCPYSIAMRTARRLVLANPVVCVPKLGLQALRRARDSKWVTRRQQRRSAFDCSVPENRHGLHRQLGCHDHGMGTDGNFSDIC